MFNNKRYITSGIQQELPLEMQILLWQMINNMEGSIQQDYLQVFTFTRNNDATDNRQQIIEHTQECPDYRKEYRFDCPEPLQLKIFVIDSGEYSTMLLAEEY